jgi:hypothetical protein
LNLPLIGFFHNTSLEYAVELYIVTFSLSAGIVEGMTGKLFFYNEYMKTAIEELLEALFSVCPYRVYVEREKLEICIGLVWDHASVQGWLSVCLLVQS